MKTVGRHLIAEYYGCERALLNDLGFLRQELVQAAELVGATVLGESFHQYEPQGVSGTLVIAESHLSIHTWPQYGYVAVDIFTCGGLDPRPGFEYLAQAIGADQTRMQEIVRGLPEDVEGVVDLMPSDVQIMSRVTSLRRPGPAASPPLSDN